MFTCATGLVVAQAQRNSRLKAVVLTVSDLPSAITQAVSSQSGLPSEASDHTQSLALEISAEFRRAGVQVIPDDQWRGTAEGRDLAGAGLLDPPRALAAARAVGADLAVIGSFSLQKRRVFLSVSCYTVETGHLAGRFTKDWPYNLSIYAGLRQETRDLVSRLGLKPAEQFLAALTFTSAQEGMEVFVAGGRSIGTINGGKLVFQDPGLKPGDALVVEKRLSGFHSALQSVRTAPTVSLSPLTRNSAVAIESTWTMGQLAGVGVGLRYYPIPDFTFISLSVYPYAQGADPSWGNWMLHVDSEVSLGDYLFLPPDSPLRVGASVGFGAILSTLATGSANAVDYLDLYVNPLSLWTELNLARVSIFLRVDTKYAIGAVSPNLLGTSLFLVGGSWPPVTLGAMYKL